MAFDSHVIHHHPSWGKADVDSTYRKGAETIGEDYRLFRERSAGWGKIGVPRRIPRQPRHPRRRP
jgi:hypothetical protein